MKVQQRIIFEFLVLFLIFPISLCFPFSIWIKIALGLAGFIYVLKILIRDRYVFFKGGLTSVPKSFIIQVAVIFTLLVASTIFYINAIDPEKLFYVVTTKPLLWTLIFFIYSLASVLPQEIIYRSFFMHRYKGLFKNTYLLILVNACVFSLGHIFFENTLVLIITFIGGLIFSYSYLKTKSLMLVFIEHTIYGYWLFTVGMGDMLGFPGS